MSSEGASQPGSEPREWIALRTAACSLCRLTTTLGNELGGCNPDGWNDHIYRHTARRPCFPRMLIKKADILVQPSDTGILIQDNSRPLLISR